MIGSVTVLMFLIVFVILVPIPVTQLKFRQPWSHRQSVVKLIRFHVKRPRFPQTDSVFFGVQRLSVAPVPSAFPVLFTKTS